MLTGERWRAGGDLHLISVAALWLGGIALTYITLSFYLTDFGGIITDGHAYWLSGQDWYQPYKIAPTHRDAFLYSPAFAQFVKPLTYLPWSAFGGLWLVAETAAFAWLLRPLGWRWALPLLLWCAPELVIGNVLGFIGVALVIAVSRPAAWSVMLLTKPTFGVGALWHLARGEWRQFAVASAATAGIALVSFALDPGMWTAWVRFLLAHSGESIWFFPGRVAAAVCVVAVAARTGRAWLLAVGLLLATPVVAGSPSLTILAAIPRLRAVGRRYAPSAEAPPSVTASQLAK